MYIFKIFEKWLILFLTYQKGSYFCLKNLKVVDALFDIYKKVDSFIQKFKKQVILSLTIVKMKIFNLNIKKLSDAPF